MAPSPNLLFCFTKVQTQGSQSWKPKDSVTIFTHQTFICLQRKTLVSSTGCQSNKVCGCSLRATCSLVQLTFRQCLPGLFCGEASRWTKIGYISGEFTDGPGARQHPEGVWRCFLAPRRNSPSPSDVSGFRDCLYELQRQISPLSS